MLFNWNSNHLFIIITEMDPNCSPIFIILSAWWATKDRLKNFCDCELVVVNYLVTFIIIIEHFYQISESNSYLINWFFLEETEGSLFIALIKRKKKKLHKSYQLNIYIFV